jgi:hypothetical protein
MREPRGGCRPLQPTRPTPHWHRRQAVAPAGFGLLPVRSPLLRESSLFLGVLRCFSSPGALLSYLRCPAVRRAGCPIRTSPDRRLPAPPRGISPRGRVLPRPPTPRHPPCAHHADILRPFPTGCCRDHASRPARASGTVPSSQSLPAAALPRSPVGSWCVFVCFCTVLCLCLRWYVTVRAGEQTRTPAPHRSPGVEQDSGHDAPSRRPSDAVGSSPSPAAAEPSGFRVAHCQGARRPDRRPDDAPVVPTTQRSSCLRGRQTSSEAVLRPRTRSPNPYAVA